MIFSLLFLFTYDISFSIGYEYRLWCAIFNCIITDSYDAVLFFALLSFAHSTHQKDACIRLIGLRKLSPCFSHTTIISLPHNPVYESMFNVYFVPCNSENLSVNSSFVSLLASFDIPTLLVRILYLCSHFLHAYTEDKCLSGDCSN